MKQMTPTIRLELLEDRTLLSVDLVRDIRPGLPDSAPRGIVAFNDQAFFTADEGGSRYLFKSDGTAAGTDVVRRLATDRTGPLNLTVSGPTLYFSLGGEELWKSDGTPAGTELVYSFYGATPCPRMQDFTPVAGWVLFTFWDVYDYGRCPGKLSSSELYISDGTEEGTTLLLRRGSEQPITNLTIAANAVFFTVGSELWATDGTPAGTRQLCRFAPGGAAYDFVSASGRLFFTANDGAHGRELWTSDGTTKGTVLVTDLRPGPESAFDANVAYSYMRELYGLVFFTATNGESGYELYRSDGTAEGTVLVADINAGPASAAPRNLTITGGILYFTADDGISGRELWASFGIPELTYLVRDVNPDGDAFPASQFISTGFADVSGFLIFVANDGQTGFELWASAGWDEATFQVRDIVAGAGSSLDPRAVQPYFTDVNGRLFFAANDGVNGVELWASFDDDGFAGGADLVAALLAADRRAKNGQNGSPRTYGKDH